jgi:type IV secretory pathway VirB4 component
MLNLAKIIKPWQESGALNAQINLYGFWNENTFLTKSGDMGTVLKVEGIDYESLDKDSQVVAVNHLEAALKMFTDGVSHLSVPTQDQPPAYSIRGIRRSACRRSHRPA